MASKNHAITNGIQISVQTIFFMAKNWSEYEYFRIPIETMEMENQYSLQHSCSLNKHKVRRYIYINC